MTAVHNTSNEHTLSHGDNESLQKIIVPDLSSFLKIKWYKGFIISVSLISIVISHFASMTRIVAVYTISIHALSDDPPVCCNDVFARGIFVDAIVKKDMDIVLFKFMNIHKIFLHVQDIIMATRKFAVLTNIVNSNEYCTLGAAEVIRSNVKFRVHVNIARSRKLWDLCESLCVKHVSHLHEHILESQIVIRLVLIGIKDIEYGRCACSTGMSCRVRKTERSNIAYICRGLTILASRDHTELCGNCAFCFFTEHGVFFWLLCF
mmetsp:Transcript_25854/g.39639  ORF Transcript_25854/g.39639 Transcript_25854/m.39639 type:complete len:263 (+) Transcript_25854:448-1236(+)